MSDTLTEKEISKRVRKVLAQKIYLSNPENREKHNARQRAYHATNRNRLREGKRICRRKHIYSISAKEYNEILLAQNNKCASCGEEETTVDKRYGTLYALAVDHNHETQQVRGLLCRKCNISLGLMKDSSANLRRLADYRDRY